MKIEIIKGDNNAVTDFFSSPSNTPETDDQPIIYAMNDNGYQVPCVDLEFARKLERERDEAIFDKNTSAADFLKQIQHITLCKDVAREKILIAEKERDETRKQFVDFLNKTENYKRERDKAREVADGGLIALERAIKYIPESSRISFEDALWRLRKKLEEENK
jgi:hypothetical protein